MKCEECGEELEGEVIKLQDLYCDAVYHFFCSEECLKEFLVKSANWEYVDVEEVEQNES